YFDVDEQTLLRIQRLVIEGKVQPRAQKAPTVYMGLADRTDYPFSGTIDFVGNQLDPSKGTIQVRAVFPNEDNALTPGLFARLRVPLGDAAPALLVTERAIWMNKGKKCVYVVNDENVALDRYVTEGAVHEGLCEILDGLAPTDRVIINGVQRVRPGIKVDP